MLKQTFQPIQSILKLQNEILEASPSDDEKIAELAEKSKKLRFAQVQGINGIEGQIPMLQLEITRCQIGPGPLGKIFEKTRELSAKTHGLGGFVVSRQNHTEFMGWKADVRCFWKKVIGPSNVFQTTRNLVSG